MSTGQLRVRAYHREKAWAPDYVANQLAGTRQAADKHRHEATLWDAQAAATAEQDASARLRDEAAKSAALAQALDDRAAQLAEADEARAAWYAHTAETRAAAERAAAELSARQADRGAEPRPVTAKEWLAAHDAEARAEDPHRPITDDHDLADVAEQRARDQRHVDQAEPPPGSAGPTPRDIRQETADNRDADKPGPRERAADADAVRVPTADETADSVRRAQRALQELKHRQAGDARRAQDEMREEADRSRADQERRTTEHETRHGLAQHQDMHEALVLDTLG
jgi:hypothetical protein